MTDLSLIKIVLIMNLLDSLKHPKNKPKVLIYKISNFMYLRNFNIFQFQIQIFL